MSRRYPWKAITVAILAGLLVAYLVSLTVLPWLLGVNR